MDFPKRSHLLYSASFALVARAILDCGRGQPPSLITARQTVDKRHHRFHIVVLNPLSPEELLAKMWTLNVQLAAWA